MKTCDSCERLQKAMLRPGFKCHEKDLYMLNPETMPACNYWLKKPEADKITTADLEKDDGF